LLKIASKSPAVIFEQQHKSYGSDTLALDQVHLQYRGTVKCHKLGLHCTLSFSMNSHMCVHTLYESKTKKSVVKTL